MPRGPLPLTKSRQVTHIVADRNYSVTHCRDGSRIMLAKTLKRMQELYPRFIRVRAGVLINPGYIDRGKLGSNTITLRDGSTFVIAKRRVEQVQAILSPL